MLENVGNGLRVKALATIPMKMTLMRQESICDVGTQRDTEAGDNVHCEQPLNTNTHDITDSTGRGRRRRDTCLETASPVQICLDARPQDALRNKQSSDSHKLFF
ncbi:hypothetical protein L596_027170 [Steinernema carpocapsae]|uniref:Uncharacterized protein n=1 Tax=Steinernema carpocapsae TaxID=34508 RepID=A0A4U5M3K6_STECR|nr:hypothetical protein L596_027170 [Steinernema carpocapsae]